MSIESSFRFEKIFKIIGFILLFFGMNLSHAAVGESQFMILEPGQLFLGTSFNYRSTKYTNSAGDTRTLTGIEQSLELSFGVFQNLTMSLGSSYIDLESQENQIASNGTVALYERSQRGLANIQIGGLYQHDFESFHLFYGLGFSLRPEKKETELNRTSEKSNAVSRQNAVIPSLGIAVPLADIITVGSRGKLVYQQMSDGKITDRRVTPEQTLIETYRDGNVVGLLGFLELNFVLKPFFSYEREWIYSTSVSREGSADYRIPGGRAENIQFGMTLPLVGFDLMPVYTYSKFNSDESGVDTQESSWLSVGISF